MKKNTCAILTAAVIAAVSIPTIIARAGQSDAPVTGAAWSVAQAQDSSSIESILIGKWNVTIGKYQDTWTFKEGGVVTSIHQPSLKGLWKQETNCILIQWEEVEKGYLTWEAFTLPLKAEGAQGGNWQGLKVFAKKL
jgi:hypothetical protein